MGDAFDKSFFVPKLYQMEIHGVFEPWMRREVTACPTCSWRGETDINGGCKSHSRQKFDANEQKTLFRAPDSVIEGEPLLFLIKMWYIT